MAKRRDIIFSGIVILKEVAKKFKSRCWCKENELNDYSKCIYCDILSLIDALEDEI